MNTHEVEDIIESLRQTNIRRREVQLLTEQVGGQYDRRTEQLGRSLTHIVQLLIIVVSVSLVAYMPAVPCTALSHTADATAAHLCDTVTQTLVAL